jgi:RNA methyltransferase, TrmH family
MRAPVHISSRDNPLLARVRRLAQDSNAYRKEGQIWLEGEHLCAALVSRRGAALQALVSASGWQRDAVHSLAQQALRIAVVPDDLFKAFSGLGSAADIGFLIEWPQPQPSPKAALPTVVLDRIQDAGNVGSVLRSAAAFGFEQVLALKGTAALWSPKVLRAGMGAHFALRLVEGAQAADLVGLRLPLLATSSHGGLPLSQTPLPWPCAWLLGHEGQGVSAELLALADLKLCIPQPGGEESLNVASAAAICLYESARQRPLHLDVASPGEAAGVR